MWHAPWVLLTSEFIHQIQQFSLYQEMHTQFAFWYMIFSSFNVSLVFKDWFNKNGYNFDDVSQNDYLRSP